MATSVVGEALGRLCAVQWSERDDVDLPDELFDRVDDLIDAYGADDVAEIVAAAVEAGQASTEQAIVFLNVAAWSGTDNGASMKSTLDEWVRKADDAVRLSIALHHEYYPLPTRTEMIARLSEIALRFPAYRAVCERHIADRPADCANSGTLVASLPALARGSDRAGCGPNTPQFQLLSQ